MNVPSNALAAASAIQTTETRVSHYDWGTLSGDLNGYGCTVLEKLLSPVECCQIAGLYAKEEYFRSHIHMARHGFGKGEYRYFKYPLPDLLADLRTTLYPRLAAIANDWNVRMGIERRYPDRHAEFLQQCHDAGQTRPTPLLLQYVPSDFNCLHQALYGDLAFPLRGAGILLSKPGADFTVAIRPHGAAPARRAAQVRAAAARRRSQPAVLTGQSKGTKGIYRVISPWGQPRPHRHAAHGRHHLPRRDVTSALRQTV